MLWLQKLYARVTAFITYSPFKDCSRGTVYERSAAYRFNRSHRHILLHRTGMLLTAIMVFYCMGTLTEMYKLVWIYVPLYVAVALCIAQIPILLFGYLYLSCWTQWNEGLK